MIAAVLALGLALSQAEEPWDEDRDGGERTPRVYLSAWGGDSFATGGSGRTSPLFGAEAAWAFDALDLGVAGYGYQRLPSATAGWSPVVLLRLTERVDTGRGFEGSFTFGFGAGRTRGWEAWYQLALGVRAYAGPLFLAGEIAFEYLSQLRLAAAVGVRF